MTDSPDPTRVVADADVLAADLLVDGDARVALNRIRDSETLTLVVTEGLLSDARGIVADLGDPSLATDWERRARADFSLVEPTLSGHPALVAAEAGNAATLLSHDERLQGAAAGVAIRQHVDTSVKSPGAFVSLLERTGFDEGE